MRKTIALFALVTTSWAAKPAAPKPGVTVPAAFRNLPADAAETSEQWWKAFGDPLLDRLIDRAVRNNLDIRKAGARLAEAEAVRRGSRSTLLPEIGATASATELRGGYSQGVVKAGGNLVSPFETSVVSGGMSMRWEIDVFRGLSKSLKASAADAQAAAENLRDAQAIVRAEVARNYIELRAAEQQIAIVRTTAESEEDLLGLIRSRAEAGLATDLDVERQAAQVSTVRAVLPDLDATRLAAVYRIGVLLGEGPGAVERDLEAANQALRLPVVPAGIPSELLRQRPDLRRAEAQIGAAYARVGAARADLYPKLVITGLSGRQATDVGGLTLGAGNFFSFGPGVSLPIFNFGRIKSQIAVRDAQLEQSLRSYEQEVLAAFEETENALASRDRAQQRRQELEKALTASRRSVELARELYVRGLGDFLTVLDAQRQQFATEREVAASDAAVLRATVGIYRSMGW